MDQGKERSLQSGTQGGSLRVLKYDLDLNSTFTIRLQELHPFSNISTANDDTQPTENGKIFGAKQNYSGVWLGVGQRFSAKGWKKMNSSQLNYCYKDLLIFFARACSNGKQATNPVRCIISPSEMAMTSNLSKSQGSGS